VNLKSPCLSWLQIKKKVIKIRSIKKRKKFKPKLQNGPWAAKIVRPEGAMSEGERGRDEGGGHYK
jgi:hypothetical protein